MMPTPPETVNAALIGCAVGLGVTSRRYKCALCGAAGWHSKNGRGNPPICGHCRKTRGIGAAGVMLQIFESAILTGVLPQKGSPCHKMLREIISVAVTPNDQAHL